MPESHFSSNAKIGLILIWLILLGLLSACGDYTVTKQPYIGGQVPANTAATQPYNIGTVAPQPTVTPAYTSALLPTNIPAPNITIDTRPAITALDPNVPIPTLKPYPTGMPVADAPNSGTTENRYGKFTNAEAMQKFLDAYAQGKPRQWEYLVYGIDSGPIPHRFVYRGNGRQYTLLIDNTKDGFAALEDRVIREYTCEGLTKAASFLDFGTCVDSKGVKNTGWSLPTA